MINRWAWVRFPLQAHAMGLGARQCRELRRNCELTPVVYVGNTNQHRFTGLQISRIQTYQRTLLSVVIVGPVP